MRDYDEVLDDLSARIAGLGGRAQAALFASCALALVPEYDEWAGEAGVCRRHAIDGAVSMALAYAVGWPPVEVRPLLADLSSHAPPDGGAGEVDACSALVAWWSARAALDVVAGRSVSTRWWLECVLQPCMVTEAAGLECAPPSDQDEAAGGAEAEAIDLVMAAPAVDAAVGFVGWAADRLAGVAVLDRPGVDELRRRAAVVAPRSGA